MTFIPTEGMVSQLWEHREIVIVGDVPTFEALRVNKHLNTAWEGILESSLHMAGLTKRDMHFINIFSETTNIKPFWIDNKKPTKRYFTPAGKERVHIFIENTIAVIEPKVVVPLGPVAVQAFLNRTDYTDIRGYPFQEEKYLVLPSLHVKDMIWGNYVWRFYLANDLRRAKEFTEGKLKIIEPELIIPQTFAETIEWLIHFGHMRRVSIDIEVNNYEVSCIGFSSELHKAVSIPIDDRWTEAQEVDLWNAIARILGDPKITKIGQNFIFDTYFLTYKNGIIMRGYIEDTMMGSSITYPDFLKGLGFLGSVHTTYTYWKDQADFKNIKEEA
jgi:uracil-DNA glycosylase